MVSIIMNKTASFHPALFFLVFWAKFHPARLFSTARLFNFCQNSTLHAYSSLHAYHIRVTRVLNEFLTAYRSYTTQQNIL